ncbi:hypothetical protein L1N85_03630 [Paenibacillus alkaliterrae]|uniref:hypothetical protein n=1 Tax=Paenibacillus alkaliterrae TaxID=320909 RepID=UPI001F39E93A|nr:hypothetical protein [Paenibacillus alkaliterrae]MCF2937521.1 hypothetical protein [Paenibacillus alkaliterrae]
MDTYGDWLIMLLAGIVLAIWMLRAFYRWLHEPASVNRLKLGKGGELKPDDENILLLERAGYEVSSGKHLVPIPILLDDVPLGKGSRLYIDYIAEKDKSMYIVKTARDRMPMDWSASGVRDRLLVYSLLLPECAGVLFVDAKDKVIRKITFHIAD